MNKPSTVNGTMSATPCQPKTTKKNFRFQIVEVPACEATKWLIWPSRKRGSQEEIDENHNHSGEAASSSDSYEVNANGYGALRRTVARQSKRDRDNCLTSRTSSEPATENRRMNQKLEKAITEPITPSSTGSNASSSFEIQSIAKKWESFDISDDLLDD